MSPAGAPIEPVVNSHNAAEREPRSTPVSSERPRSPKPDSASQLGHRCDAASARDLLQLVKSRLETSGYRSLSAIRCRVYEDLVVLSGVVPSFYMKQIAQTVVMKTGGVNGIENRLRVESSRKTKEFLDEQMT